MPRIELLATPGKLLSDDYLLLQTMLTKTGQKPALLILTYSFRDFQDNLAVKDLSQTPIARMLDFSQTNLHFYPNLFNCMTLPGFAQELSNTASSHKSHYLAVASFYRHTVADYFADLTAKWRRCNKNQSARIIETKSAIQAAPASPESNIDEYTKRYRPFDQHRFEIQISALEDSLKLARDSGLPVVLINMPITAANRELISDPASDWQKPIRVLAEKYNCELGDFDAKPLNAQLNDSDFNDSAHLNKAGQAKFLAVFAPWLKQTKAYNRAFAK